MMPDDVHATDDLSVSVRTQLNDSIKVRTHLLIERFDESQAAFLDRLNVCPCRYHFAAYWIRPYSTSEVFGNLVTTAGLNRLTSLIIAGGGQAPTNTSARIGVGNGVGSAAVGDTDLSAAAGSANRWYQIMDATYPQQSNGTLTFRSSYASADGNFAWNEFGIDVGTPTVVSGNTVAALLLNHKTSIAQGTKASGQVWTATATIVLS